MQNDAQLAIPDWMEETPEVGLLGASARPAQRVAQFGVLSEHADDRSETSSVVSSIAPIAKINARAKKLISLNALDRLISRDEEE